MFLNDPTVEHRIDAESYVNRPPCKDDTSWIPDWHWTFALLILLSLEENENGNPKLYADQKDGSKI